MTNKVHLICGTVCAGKTYYARTLAEKTNAVILSCDELENDIFDKQLGALYDDISPRIKSYLMKKTAETALCGCDVILDWGFWSAEERKSTAEYFSNLGIEVIWYYISVSPKRREKNIALRNKAVSDGISTAYYVDSGLLAKSNQRFEPPSRDEIDIWIENN